MIEGLRYVRLGVADLEAARDFATRIVGLQPVDAPPGLAMFRSDARDHTLVLHAAAKPEETLALEVRTAEALAALGERLTAAGYKVTEGSAEDCAQRRCKAMLSFRIRQGLTVELVWRHFNSGWRYFGARDAGITDFFGVALASTDVEADIALWTGILGARVTDWIGDGAYLALDGEHHRIAIHPSPRDGILEMQFRVEGMHQLMQCSYFLQGAQVPVVHGPGRRPASGQVFITFRGPTPMLFGYVAEGEAATDRPPRQFPKTPASFCAWGSSAQIPEYGGAP